MSTTQTQARKPLGATTSQLNPNPNPNPMLQGPLMKKGLLGRAGRGGFAGAGANKGNMVSPTDNMLSPCSAKLSESKKRHFQKGKPVHLASQLSSLASSDSSSSLASTAAQGSKENQLPKAEF